MDALGRGSADAPGAAPLTKAHVRVAATPRTGVRERKVMLLVCLIFANANHSNESDLRDVERSGSTERLIGPEVVWGGGGVPIEVGAFVERRRNGLE